MMERLLVIAMAWIFIVGGAVFLAVLIERVLHQRKMARLQENFTRMKLGVSAQVGLSPNEGEKLRRSA